MKKYEQYTNGLPEEIRLILSSLDSSIRQAILVLLVQNEKLSFSIMKGKLDLGKLILNYHLKKLYSSGLIDHYFERELGNKEYSYYSITKLGERFLNGLTTLLIPQVPFEKLRKPEVAPKIYELFTKSIGSCQTQHWMNNMGGHATATVPSCTFTEFSDFMTYPSSTGRDEYNHVEVKESVNPTQKT